MPEKSLLCSLYLIYVDSRAVCVLHLHSVCRLVVSQYLAFCFGQLSLIEINLTLMRVFFLKLLWLTGRLLVSSKFIIVFLKLYIIKRLGSLAKYFKQIPSHLQVLLIDGCLHSNKLGSARLNHCHRADVLSPLASLLKHLFVWLRHQFHIFSHFKLQLFCLNVIRLELVVDLLNHFIDELKILSKAAQSHRCIGLKFVSEVI